MTLENYILLTIDERADVLWAMGVFVERYIDETRKLNLYSLFDYFVEVEYSPADGKIIDVYPFKKGPRMEKYLSKIELPPIS